jgi:polyhydroxyalkanoate synthesis regulator phasin
VYVQDRMRENARELWAWLKGGAHFYVCGDAKRMAKDVDTALHDIIADQGGMSVEQAVEYVKQLKKEAEENAGEHAATAQMLADLQKQMADERATYGKKVDATLKKVATATNLDDAKNAGAELKATAPLLATAFKNNGVYCKQLPTKLVRCQVSLAAPSDASTELDQLFFDFEIVMDDAHLRAFGKQHLAGTPEQREKMFAEHDAKIVALGKKRCADAHD